MRAGHSPGPWEGDAHLLLLPVRSFGGIVCYATSRFVLHRYAQDLRRAGQEGVPSLPPIPRDDEAQIPEDSVNTMNDKLILEDIDLNASENAKAKANDWAKAIADAVHPGADNETAREDLRTRFAVLPDPVFGFLAETATEIRTRIAIDENTGTVKKGALWYEENLPAETVLWGVHALTDARHSDDGRDAEALATRLPQCSLLQLGGKAGVGRGLVRFLSTPREVSA